MPHSLSSKNFWKYCKPFFTIQITKFDDKILLVENKKLVSKNKKIAYLFNTYFNDITKRFKIERCQCSNLPCEDPLVNAIGKYQIHSIILKIKSVFTSVRLFDFSFISSDDISKVITSLDSTKKTSSVFPRKIVKLPNKEICQDLANCIDEAIKKNEFPNEFPILTFS